MLFPYRKHLLLSLALILVSSQVINSSTLPTKLEMSFLKLEKAHLKLESLTDKMEKDKANALLLNDKAVLEMRLAFNLLDSSQQTFKKALQIDPNNVQLIQNFRELNDYLPLNTEESTEKTTAAPNTPATDPQRQLIKKVFGKWLTNPTVKRHTRRAFGLFRPVQITNAFTKEFSNHLHEELYKSPYFKMYEGSTPFYQFHLNAIYDDDPNFQKHPYLKMALKAMNTDSILDWIADVSNSEIEKASLGATLYKPGDHTQAHTDVKDNEDGTIRRVAYIVHLAKRWNPSFGGDLVHMKPTTHILPLFNAITIFPVSHGGWHFVTPVMNRAEFPKYQRLAVSGWFMSDLKVDNHDQLHSLSTIEHLGADREEKFGYWHVNGNTGEQLEQVNLLNHDDLNNLWEKQKKKRKRKKRQRPPQLENRDFEKQSQNDQKVKDRFGRIPFDPEL
jgi:hypothetical protein